MLSCFVGLWVAAAVGQAQPEAAWLKAVPGDVPVVVRVRAMDRVRDDLVAMIAAMSPDSAEPAKEGIAAGLQYVGSLLGEEATKSPILVMLRPPDLAKPAAPEWAAILKAGDYAATVKALTVADGDGPKVVDGLDSFTGRDGRAWYAAGGDGWVAAGPSRALVEAVRKPRSTLDARLSPESRAKFLEGDVALYVDVVAVRKQYGAALEKFAPDLVALAEQANAEQPAQAVQGAKAMIAGATELMKVGDGLILTFDFDAAGLTFSGLATIKAGSPAAKDLAETRTVSGDLMAKLPSDMTAYFAVGDADPQPIDVRRSALSPKLPRPADSPEVAKAVSARMKALDGRQVMGVSLMPMRVISLADPADPGAAVKASMDAKRAAKGGDAGGTTVEADAMTYGGFKLGRIREKIDPKMVEQIIAARPDVPNLAGIVKMMIPNDNFTEYVGTDGKLFLSTMAPADDQVKAHIDAIKDDARNLGGLASWKALRARMPKRARVFLVFNAQETVKMILAIVGAVDNNPAAKPPADLPKTIALMGFALTSSPDGYDFRLVVPSEVGPVFEKGLAPLGEGQ